MMQVTTSSPTPITDTVAAPHESIGLIGVPPMPACFVGRYALLTDIVERLGNTDQAIASSDVNGTGKTAFAVAVARHPRMTTEFPDGILWAPLWARAGTAGMADARDALAQWAAALGLALPGDTDPYSIARAVHDAIGARRMLLVLDDAWDRDTAFLLRCGGPNCRHLLMTRDAKLARAFAGEGHTHQLPPLTQQESVELLTALSPRACAADQQAVGELAQAANGLPLALVLLGGYLDAVDYTPAEEPLASSDEPAIVERHRLAFARQRLGTHTHTQTTLQQVIALCMAVLPDAVLRALRILGVFAPYPATFTRQAALAVTGVDDRLLNQLINRRLLDRVNSRLNTAGMSELLTIHAGVAGVARARADAKTAAHHRAFYLAQSVMAREVGQPIDHCYAQIRHAWQNAPDEPALIEFAWALQPYLQRNLLTTDQALLASRCQAIIASAAGSKSTLAAVELPVQLNRILDIKLGASTLAEVLHHIGLAYDSAGKHDRAVSFYNRALSIQEKQDDALATAKTLRQMGESYASLGMIEESQEYFTRALTAFEHLQQAETGKPRGLRAVRTPPPPAAISSDLGTIYNALGRYDQALSILQRNLEVTETAQRDDSPARLAETLNQMAYASDRLGQSDKALEYYQRALDLYEVLGNRSDTQRAVILNRMGVIFAGKGQAEKALMYHNLALGLADRDGAAATNNHLADAALLLGKPEQALIYVQRALSVYEASNTQPAWLGAARAYRVMGHAQRRLGQREQALESFQRAKALYERAGASAKPANEDSLDLADVLVQIGEMLRKLLQLSKALDMLLQALALLEALLKGLPTAAQKGERLHTRVIAQIGAIYTSLGSPEPAMQYLARALPLQEQSGDAAGESETRFHLALLHQSQGRLDKSVSNLQRAIELDQQLDSEELADHQALLEQVQSAMQTDHSNGNKPRGLFAFLRRNRK